MLRAALLMQYCGMRAAIVSRKKGRKERTEDSGSNPKFEESGSDEELTAVARELSLKYPPSEPQMDETPKICFPLPFFKSGRHAAVRFMTPKRFVVRFCMTRSGLLYNREVSADDQAARGSGI